MLQSVLVVEGPYVLSRRKRDPNASMVTVAITRCRVCASPVRVECALLLPLEIAMLSPGPDHSRRGSPSPKRGPRDASTTVRSEARQMPVAGICNKRLCLRSTAERVQKTERGIARRQTLARKKCAAAKRDGGVYVRFAVVRVVEGGISQRAKESRAKQGCEALDGICRQ